MSDAGAEVFTPSGELIGYTTYQGSADVLNPGLSADLDAAFDRRRTVAPGNTNPWDRLRDCGHEGEEAIVYSDYGGGDHWPVKVCRECRIITENLSPYPDDGYGYNLPSADEQAQIDAWRQAGWPKDGHPFPGTTPYGTPVAS
jgi:hypothetical protein